MGPGPAGTIGPSGTTWGPQGPHGAPQWDFSFLCSDLCLSREDLWVREGKILDPEKLFFDEQGYADQLVDCEDSIIAPGFIDVQINGEECEGTFGTSSSNLTPDQSGSVFFFTGRLRSSDLRSPIPAAFTVPLISRME
uniref:Uncharacterized protein n=1 Tax=Cyprinodon variegatus TaxID=28743 RepID=A0A3Q2E755_CYPVA